VSFSYDAYSHHAAPINPKIFRVRTDVSWKDLVVEHARDSSQFINGMLSERREGKCGLIMYGSKFNEKITFKNTN
jgi:hypothetical protein